MSEHLDESEQSRLDEQVAALADHLMNKDSPDPTGAVQDDELSAYRELLTRLSGLASDAPPDPQMADRVKKKLVAEWGTVHPGLPLRTQTRQKAKPVHPSVYQSTRKRQIFTLRFAFAAVVLVVLLAFFISPTVTHAIPGAAGGQIDLILFLGLLSLLLGLGFWWFLHRKG